ncbi:TonB-dependent receptor [Persicobacter psychrovividus]|uniref:TonB-dependent receptor n=1 Tax=Persicobacter psychrovividus TaxID=387638 RepID=A0ABN6L9T9_9BACT|nr:TonB-dependent receptor [Persicobacter psychrovividus]
MYRFLTLATFSCLSLLIPIMGFAQKTPIDQKIKVTHNYLGRTKNQILQHLIVHKNLRKDGPEKIFSDELTDMKFYRKAPIKEVLDDLFEGTDFHYKLMADRTLVIRKTDVKINALDQIDATRSNFSLLGTVKDFVTGEPLPYATIQFAYGTGKVSSTTNLEGLFNLKNVASDTVTLLVKYLGYQTVNYKLTPERIKNNHVTILMENDAMELEQVVISDFKENQIMKLSGEPGRMAISPAQLRGLPSLGEKDIFRSLQLLPGISGTNETSSGLYVRGGTPDQNLILLDHIPIFHVDHLYGFFSAFNTQALKDVQVYKGGFGVPYGGKMSSVVDITGKKGNAEYWQGNVNLSGLSASALLDGPINNGKGSALIAFRRSFQSSLFNNINDVYDNGNTVAPTPPGGGPGGGRPGGGGGGGRVQSQPSLYFWDLNAKVSHQLGEKDQLSFSYYQGKDNMDNSRSFSISRPGTESVDISAIDENYWGNIGSNMQWNRQWNHRLFSSLNLSYSQYFNNRERSANVGRNEEEPPMDIENNSIEDLRLQWDFDYNLSDRHQLKMGSQIDFNRAQYEWYNQDTTYADHQLQGNTFAFYLQDEWKIGSALSLTGGLRTTYYDITDQFYSSARLSARLKIAPNTHLKGAVGNYYQFSSRITRDNIDDRPREFWLIADGDHLPVGQSTHYLLGLTHEWNNLVLDAELFYKTIDGLSEYSSAGPANSGRPGGSIDIGEENFYQGTGYTQGMELLLQKKAGNFTGWVGYTLSQVVYDFPELTDQPFYALHDQTHEFKMVGNYKWNSWIFAGSWIYGTGKPYTAVLGSYTSTLPDGSLDYHPILSDKNEYRLPDYHRLDVSITHEWKLSRRSALDVGITFFNLYNRDNVWYKQYDIVEGELIETEVNTLGFTPNFFINLKF